VEIYLDHASTSWPKAAGVAEAMAAAVGLAGSARRGGGSGAREGERLAEELRRGLAAAVGQCEPRRVVLTPGATHSIGMGILGVATAARMRGRVARVVTTHAEHNAVRRAVLALAERGEIELVVVAADRWARVEADAVAAAATGGGRAADLVVMASASNVTGASQPVGQVWDSLRHTSTLLMVDASQTAGVSGGPIVGDLVAFGAHKRFRGPAGIGALVIGERAHPLELGGPTPARGGGGVDGARLVPVIVGGAGHSSEDADMPGSLPQRFEPGTMNTPATAGWLAAINAARSAGSAGSDSRAMAEHLAQGLRGLGGMVPVFRPEVGERGASGCEPIVSFTVEGYAPDEAAAVLESEFGIVVRAGLHCAPGAHEAMGTRAGGGTVRASLGETTVRAEIEALIEAVGQMV